MATKAFQKIYTKIDCKNIKSVLNHYNLNNINK